MEDFIKADRFNVIIGMERSITKEMQAHGSYRSKDCKNLLKKLKDKRYKIYKKYNKKHNSKMNNL